MIVFLVKANRCPGCGNFVGQSIRTSLCPKCGARLLADKD